MENGWHPRREKSHVTLLQEVSESTPLKFLKHGAPLYRKITTLATATTFRPFQEKQLVNGQAFLLARLLVSSAQVLILWGFTEYSVMITCAGLHVPAGGRGSPVSGVRRFSRFWTRVPPRPRTESWHLLRAFSTRPRRPSIRPNPPAARPWPRAAPVTTRLLVWCGITTRAPAGTVAELGSESSPCAVVPAWLWLGSS